MLIPCRVTGSFQPWSLFSYYLVESLDVLMFETPNLFFFFLLSFFLDHSVGTMSEIGQCFNHRFSVFQKVSG